MSFEKATRASAALGIRSELLLLSFSRALSAVIMIRLRASAALGRAKTRFVLHSLARALRCLLKNKNCLTKKYHYGKSSYLLYISPHGNCWSQRYRSAATVQYQSAKNSIQKSICLLILDILNIFGKILV